MLRGRQCPIKSKKDLKGEQKWVFKKSIFAHPLNPFLQILPFDTAQFVICHEDFRAYNFHKKTLVV